MAEQNLLDPIRICSSLLPRNRNQPIFGRREVDHIEQCRPENPPICNLINPQMKSV